MSKLYLRLAKTNILNNKSLYLPYLISGITTVAMFYLMMFLNNNPGMGKIPGATALVTIMGFGVVIVTIFSYIFVFYTNSFIIKRRKKEIAIYNILGMEKRHIAKLLSLETVFVAVIAIVGGIAFGILCSKLILMILYRLLDITESVTFYITQDGIVAAILIFALLYILTLVYNLLQIKLANPMELLRGSNAGEREPKTKVFMAIAGIACIAVAYYISFTTEQPIKVLSLFFLAVLLVIIGTYFLFTAGSIALLKMLRKNRRFYYNKKHFVAVSGMLYRMKQNAVGLASICILSTMVLVMVSMTTSLFAGVNDSIQARYPNDINVFSDYDQINFQSDKIQQEVQKIIRDEGRSITGKKTYTYLEMNAKESSDGQSFEKGDPTEYNGSQSRLNLITWKDLMAMDPDLTKEGLEAPEKGSVYVFGSRDYEGNTISILDQTFKVAESRVYTPEKDQYNSTAYRESYYIVLDSEKTFGKLYNKYKTEYGEFANYVENITGYDIDGSKEEKIACETKLRTFYDNFKMENYDMIFGYMEARGLNEKSFYLLYGGLFFLGLFLAIMFLMMTVMIIFYKQISEGYEDQMRYQILEKVGMSSREVKVSIQSQIRIVFFLPLITAAVHLFAAFPMVRKMLTLFQLNNIKIFVICMIVTILIFALIYYLVFRVTSRAYYRIVGALPKN